MVGPWGRLTEEDRILIERLRTEFFCDDDSERMPGRRCEEPEAHDREYTGLDEDESWWEGEERYCLDEDGDVADPYGVLPSERFYGRL